MVTLSIGINGKVNAYSFFIVLICPFITQPNLDRVTSIFKMWSLKKELPVDDNIFNSEYLRYILSDWDQTAFGKSRMTMTFYFVKKFYVTSGLAEMTSISFQLWISLLYYVELSRNLVREIWVVHMTLNSYKIACAIEGYVDLWGQLQGKCIFFLYRLICQCITPSILDRITSNLQLWSFKKGTSGCKDTTSSMFLNSDISVIYCLKRRTVTMAKTIQ